jgi:hypothetical protein
MRPDTRAFVVAAGVFLAALAPGCGFDWNVGRPSADAGVVPDASEGSCSSFPGALLCEDFESGDLDRWSDVSGGLAPTEAQAHGGSRSLAASATEESFIAGEFAAVTSDSLFVRAYVRRDLASVTDSVTLLSLEAVDDAVWYTDLFVLDDRAGVYLEWDSGSGDNGTESAPLDLSAGWTCLTWEIDMEAGAIRLAREGAPVASLEPPGEVAPSIGYNLLTVGVRDNDEQTTDGTWYFDSIVVDDAPIACDP